MVLRIILHQLCRHGHFLDLAAQNAARDALLLRVHREAVVAAGERLSDVGELLELVADHPLIAQLVLLARRGPSRWPIASASFFFRARKIFP